MDELHMINTSNSIQFHNGVHFIDQIIGIHYYTTPSRKNGLI